MNPFEVDDERIQVWHAVDKVLDARLALRPYKNAFDPPLPAPTARVICKVGSWAHARLLSRYGDDPRAGLVSQAPDKHGS